jgi:hypothetical protein
MRLGQQQNQFLPWEYFYGGYTPSAESETSETEEVSTTITVPKTTGSWFESFFMLTGTQLVALALVGLAAGWWLFKKR